MSGRPAAPSASTLAALDRLAQSRERLRRALADPGDAHRGSHTGSATGGAPNHPNDVGGGRGAQPRRPTADPMWAGWLGPLAAIPAVSLLLELVRLWWARQPVRVLLLVAGNAAELVLQPVARQHPVRLVLGAAAVGAALVALRPWRWVYRSAVTPALLLGLLPQAISRRWRDPRPG